MIYSRVSPISRLKKRVSNAGYVRWFYSDRYLLLHAIDAGLVKPVVSDEFHINCLEDLELFEETERWLSREQFIIEANRRIEKGMQLYTAVSGDVLIHWGWLVPLEEYSWFPYVSQRYEYPDGAAVLFNAYTHPRARGTGLHTRSMMRRIADGAARPGIQYVYTAIESQNRTSRAVAARCGFKCVNVLYERIRLGKVQRGSITPGEYLESVENSI